MNTREASKGAVGVIPELHDSIAETYSRCGQQESNLPTRNDGEGFLKLRRSGTGGISPSLNPAGDMPLHSRSLYGRGNGEGVLDFCHRPLVPPSCQQHGKESSPFLAPENKGSTSFPLRCRNMGREEAPQGRSQWDTSDGRFSSGPPLRGDSPRCSPCTTRSSASARPRTGPPPGTQTPSPPGSRRAHGVVARRASSCPRRSLLKTRCAVR